jgi:hypothetical protein
MWLCGAAACGQELVLPESKPTNVMDAPSEGFTGASGAPDDAAPSKRLPVADKPTFTTFGGAGGDSAASDDDSGGHGGIATPSTGGTKTSGGAGGAKPSAGSGGAKPTGGNGGNSGTKPNGGAGAGTMAGLGGASEAGGAGTGSVTSAPAALMFSEYVEGSGSFKALEIYALEASSLEGCELQTYFNGKLEPARLALHGELAQGDVQVLCSSALAAAQPNACSRSTSLTFNGDDALALSCDGALLDVIGQIGVDPGDAWGAGATADHTLRRRCSVAQGRSDGNQPFEIDAEWLTLGVDTFADLGVRSCSAP